MLMYSVTCISVNTITDTKVLKPVGLFKTLRDAFAGMNSYLLNLRDDVEDLKLLESKRLRKTLIGNEGYVFYSTEITKHKTKFACTAY